jgi:hypothetical protein
MVDRLDAAALLSSDALSWPAGEAGPQNVSLAQRLLGLQAQQLSALVVQVGNVTDADLDLEHSTTLVSNIPHANLTTGFSLVPNQVSAVAAFHRLCCRVSLH